MKILVVLIALLALALAVAGIGSTPPEIDSGVDYNVLNPGFIPNAGQYEPGVDYILQSRGATIFFTRNELVLTHASGDVIRQSFAGASPGVNLIAKDQHAGVVNHYAGNDPSKWVSDIPVYAKIVYEGLYPGIDLVYTEESGRLKREFHVSAGADPSQIELIYEGASAPCVDEDGVLRFASPAGEMLESPLVCWQVIDGERIDRVAEYIVDCGSVRISVTEYDAGHELIIDPELVYSSYLGGSDNEYGSAIVDDGAGGVWVTGYTESADFPLVNQSQDRYGGGGCDVFVTHFASDGTRLSSTYLGGNETDHGVALAGDGDGGVWVMGTTKSADFPVRDAYQDRFMGGCDVFVAHFAPNGTLISSTYLGGSRSDYGSAIVDDGDGGVWVTGTTWSYSLETQYQTLYGFPVLNETQDLLGGQYDTAPGQCNAFASHFSSSGTLISSTYLGGDDKDHGVALAGDGDGGVWVAGNTSSSKFPVKNASQPDICGKRDIFVTHFSPAGRIISSTYLGGDGTEDLRAMISDDAGGVWVTGVTPSPHYTPFPTVNTSLDTYGGGIHDTFVTHFSSDGAILSSAYLGGEDEDSASALAPDGAGGVWVAGTTGSSSFPVKNECQDNTNVKERGWWDAFVTHFSSNGSLISSTYLGGYNREFVFALAPDNAGGVWVAGMTCSDDFPVLNGFQMKFGEWHDAFISHFSSDGTLLSSSYLGGGSEDSASALAKGGSGAVWIMGKTTSTNFPVENPSQRVYKGSYDLFVAKVVAGKPVLPPSAGFTANVTAGVAPLAVKFTGESTGDVTSWFWDFGDGATSTSQSPVYIYRRPGNYTVNLTATTTEGPASLSRPAYIAVTAQKGDLNGDGEVDISDVAKVAYMVVRKEPADLAADFNGNDRVDIGDAAKIAYFFVGKIDML